VAAALALKVTVVVPAATVTDAGTVSEELFEASVTLEPAVPLRVTVQTLEPPGPTEIGAHLRVLIVNGATTEMEPPVAVTDTPPALEDAPSTLVSPIVEVPVAADIVTETIATVPL
jgi:hypothetical protein